MRKFKNSAAVLLSLILALAMLAGCGSGSSDSAAAAESGESAAENTEAADDADKYKGQSLNLYTWDGMFPQEVLDEFQSKYGVTINYSNFDYDEDMLAKLEETKGGEYDVVIADDYILELVNKEGLSMELDKSKIPNWSNLDSRFLGLFYDPEDKYDAPYGAGIPLIVYDPSATDVKIEGFADLWDPSLKDNVALIGNYRVIDGFTLQTLGGTLNSEEVDLIEQAGEKLLELAPNVRAINDNNTQDLLISGEVAAAFLYTSQVTQAIMANPELVQVYPKEGLGFGTMCMFIPSQAPNADLAHEFINYILDSEVSAKCFEYMGYYSTTKTAEEFMSEEMKPLLILPEDAPGGTPIENISQEANDAHEKIWAAFQNACGQS